MQRAVNRSLFMLVMLPWLVLLDGCGTTTPSRFYMLTPVQSDDAPAELEKLRIGIGPITFPEYLRRSPIVTRQSDGTELIVDETHRWAEPLPENFARVLAENTATRLGTERLVVYPWNRGAELDYQVPIEILRFDADRDRQVMLDVRWRILDAEDALLIGPRRQRIVIHGESPGYTGLVLAQSRAVARLAASIVDEIRELERPRR
jgi:uncharacterized lipoprotein YmbA